MTKTDPFNRFRELEELLEILNVEKDVVGDLGTKLKTRYEGKSVDFRWDIGGIRVTGETMTIMPALYSTDKFLVYALKMIGVKCPEVVKILKKTEKLPIGTGLPEIRHLLRGKISGKKFNF
jgi:hypothetical protein